MPDYTARALRGPMAFLYISAFLLAFGLANLESILGLFGKDRFNMGPADIAIAPGTPFFSTFLQDVRVLFDGVPAPIIYVQQKQISVVAPWSVNALASTKIQVEYKGQRSDARELRVGAVAPGIFSGNSSGSMPYLVGP